MTDQVRIGDDGHLEIERTWDGEPLYSPSTVQESLFAGDAFQQMPGQLAIDAQNYLEDQLGMAWDAEGGFWENRERNS